jgi:putative spermidine/putrescine transport system permease protein
VTSALEPVVKHWRTIVLIGPPVTLFALVFAVPVLVMLAGSFDKMDPATYLTVERPSLANYVRFLTSTFYLTVLFDTIRISTLVTLLCLMTGYPVALYLNACEERERQLLSLLIISPLLVSLVIRTFGWLIVLGQHGLINVLLMKAALVERPLQLTHKELAVILGLSHVFWPFMVLSILAALQNVDTHIVQAARNLGASPFTAFRRITLPLSLPGVFGGSVIVFSLSVSSFVTPAILGGSWVKMLAVLAYEQTVTVLDWGFGATICVVLLLITLGLIGLSTLLVARGSSMRPYG